MIVQRELLKSLISTIAGNVDTAWSNEPIPQFGMTRDGVQAWIELQTVSLVEVNIDETRLKYDATLDVNDVVIVGQRRFTLSLVARSYELDVAGYQILARVRFRLRTNTARNILVPQGLALVRMEPILHLGEDVDTRAVSKASMDVTFAGSFRDDPQDDDGVYIATVNGGGVIPMTFTQ